MRFLLFYNFRGEPRLATPFVAKQNNRLFALQLCNRARDEIVPLQHFNGIWRKRLTEV